MSKRSSPPPLYELMTSSRSQVEVAVEDDEEDVDLELEGGGASVLAWLSPGRTVRVPVGYALLGAGGVLLVLVLVYTIGFSRGGGAARARFGEQYLETTNMAGLSERARDPTSQEQGVVADVLTFVSPEPREAAAVGSQWGPIDSDPRERGLHYFVLATTLPEGARRLATFCRTNRLEAYVVRSDNVRFRLVIALPGYPTRSRSDPDVSRLLDHIHQVGRAWKKGHPSDRDFSEAFMIP